MLTPDRSLIAAVLVHVVAVVAFLTAIAAGGGPRVLVALLLAVAASVVWIGWLRRAGRSAWEAVPVPPVPHELDRIRRIG